MTAPKRDREDPKVKEYVGTGFYIGLVVLLVMTFAVIVFTAQNTASVTVKWLGWQFQAPLVAIVLVVAFFAAVLDELIGWVWRRRRRRVLTERAELAQLRTAASDDVAIGNAAGEPGGEAKDADDAVGATAGTSS